MRPCDCESRDDTKRYLKEQGISYNDYSLTVLPSYVLIEMTTVKIKIPMFHFKRFAEWYLEDQNDEFDGNLINKKMPW